MTIFRFRRFISIFESIVLLGQQKTGGSLRWRQPLVLHSNNGAPMKSSTLLAKLYELGVMPSRGRPRVSNDNPYSESMLRTLKYCPQWPAQGFADLDAARAQVRDLIASLSGATISIVKAASTSSPRCNGIVAKTSISDEASCRI